MEPTRQELDARAQRFTEAMTESFPAWDTALFLSRACQYYFTGTIQDAMLLIQRDGSRSYYVRKSFERACEESPLKDCIHPMRSYRDAATLAGGRLGNTYFEAEVVPNAVIERIQSYFQISSLGSLEGVMRALRAVKSPFELEIMARAGKEHHRLLTEVVPSILREGISEAEFTGDLYAHMMKCGFQGTTRFFGYHTEMSFGQFAFGENTLYPTNFDGPNGMRGAYPGVPVGGSHTRRLKKGDLVSCDFGFGLHGYHTDKTQVYMFQEQPSEEAALAQQMCIDILRRTAALLKPGAVPGEIYSEIVESLDSSQLKYFMGSSDPVKFLGHGIGLYVNDAPVIAAGVKEPLLENITLAIEPRKGVMGVGLVGVEDTFVVSPEGGRCLTGGPKEIMVVG